MNPKNFDMAAFIRTTATLPAREALNVFQEKREALETALRALDGQITQAEEGVLGGDCPDVRWLQQARYTRKRLGEQLQVLQLAIRALKRRAGMRYSKEEDRAEFQRLFVEEVSKRLPPEQLEEITHAVWQQVKATR